MTNAAEIYPDEAQCEAATIRRILNGESELFGDLFRPHQKRLRAYALTILRNAEDADDAIQNTALQAFRQLRTYRYACRFSTWIFVIARNESLQIRRKLLRHMGNATPARDDSGAPLEFNFVDKGPTPFDLMAKKQEIEFVNRSLLKIPESMRIVLAMKECEGLRIRHIATRLNLTQEAVKSRLFRARNLMAQGARRRGDAMPLTRYQTSAGNLPA